MTPNDKQALLAKFESVCPWLKELDNFGFEVPVDGTRYRLYPEPVEGQEFRNLVIDVATGEHSTYYRKVDLKARLTPENKMRVVGTLD